jgi:hypothetical protein
MAIWVIVWHLMLPYNQPGSEIWGLPAASGAYESKEKCEDEIKKQFSENSISTFHFQCSPLLFRK